MVIFMNTKTRGVILNIVYSGLLIAIGILLPQLFHVFGPAAGKTFLPMHIPVLLAGFLVGPLYGLGVAILVPILSSVITGMPPVPMLYFMLFELVTYAVVAGILYKKLKLNLYVALIGAMICGRLIYGLSLVVVVNLLGMTFPFTNVVAFFGSMSTGIPGIIIQIVVVPPLIFALKKGGLIIANRATN